jgi:hypothetical protein
VRLLFGLKGDHMNNSIMNFLPIIIQRFPVAMKLLLAQLVSLANWNIVWFIFLLSIWLFLKKPINKHIVFILCVFWFQFIFLISAYAFFPATTEEMVQWFNSSLHRLLIQIFPLALFFIAQYLGAAIENIKVKGDNIG